MQINFVCSDQKNHIHLFQTIKCLAEEFNPYHSQLLGKNQPNKKTYKKTKPPKTNKQKKWGKIKQKHPPH